MQLNLFAIAFLLNSVLLVLLTRVVQTQAQPDLRTEIESIQSVAQVKTEIKQFLAALDRCGNGMVYEPTPSANQIIRRQLGIPLQQQ